MIEPMKFVSISGPRDDLDRMVNQVLCRYEIHLENALTELKSVSKLIPCPGTNPYREPYEAAESWRPCVPQERRLPKHRRLLP